MAEHTKEPWGQSGNYPWWIVAFDGTQYRDVALCEGSHGQEVQIANARHIVAAVNCCSGIPTSTLAALGEGGVAKRIESWHETLVGIADDASEDISQRIDSLRADLQEYFKK